MWQLQRLKAGSDAGSNTHQIPCLLTGQSHSILKCGFYFSTFFIYFSNMACLKIGTCGMEFICDYSWKNLLQKSPFTNVCDFAASFWWAKNHCRNKSCTCTDRYSRTQPEMAPCTLLWGNGRAAHKWQHLTPLPSSKECLPTEPFPLHLPGWS